MAHRGIFLGLGSNIGNTETNIDNACRHMLKSNIHIVNESSLYITKPWGKTDQPDFLNCIIEVNTAMTPRLLLSCIHDIEQHMKRVRKEHWGPRIIDIDIILYNDIILASKDLIIPHQHLKERYFWLYMLNEMYEDVEIPPDMKTPADIMNNDMKKHQMKFVEKRQYSQWR